MKSEFSMESKYRAEGRHSLPRRRVAMKTSHCDGGDFEMELSLAIQESLKYAKEQEKHLRRADKKGSLLNGVTSDESFSRMAGKMLTASGDQGSGEIKQLKDLLLIHIELIQHQQELLSNKDKEIRTLRAEKDALQCRLDKVERRVSLMKHKEEAVDTQVTKDVVAELAHPAPPDKTKKMHTSKSEPAQKGRKRRGKQGRAQQPAKIKKRSVQSDKESESVTSSDSDDSDAESDSEEQEDEQETEEDTSASDVDVEGPEGEGEGKMVEGGEEESRDPHPHPVLRTDCMYHVTCCVELPPDEPVELVEEKEVHSGEQVETPGWRINVLTNRYQLEGTENITDEAYQKRHQKHEVEEKRRKRWDIQRMREQRVFEKLRGKEEQAARFSQEDKDVKTFLPCIDDLTHVEILDTIPVTAFGQTVPHIEPSEFELPWDTRPSTNLSRKSSGGRGRQK